MSLGVHVIIGAHPHVLQPHCIHDNKLVAYSLGNFLFYPNQPMSGINPVNVSYAILVTTEIHPVTCDVFENSLPKLEII